ncbi:MAG: hypothetical protein OXI63_00525 [Candidatus Poribacteria bacterium]|nr:hypothetical protein [Candidatus Poribacteria bacterium]
MDKQKILILDSEPLATSQLVGFLSGESYEVFTAENGMAGLDILRKEKIDLAVSISGRMNRRYEAPKCLRAQVRGFKPLTNLRLNYKPQNSTLL